MTLPLLLSFPEAFICFTEECFGFFFIAWVLVVDGRSLSQGWSSKYLSILYWYLPTPLDPVGTDHSYVHPIPLDRVTYHISDFPQLIFRSVFPSFVKVNHSVMRHTHTHMLSNLNTGLNFVLQIKQSLPKDNPII